MFQRDMMADGYRSGYMNIPGLIKRSTSAGTVEYPYIPPQIDPSIYISRPNWGDPNQHEEFKRKEAAKQFEELITKHFKKSTKTPFEEILEQLFSLSEKEQFLIDLGYILEWDNQDGSYDIYKMESGTKVMVSGSKGKSVFEDLFLKEISIKFKNLLLAKPKLTVKI